MQNEVMSVLWCYGKCTWQHDQVAKLVLLSGDSEQPADISAQVYSKVVRTSCDEAEQVSKCAARRFWQCVCCSVARAHVYSVT
jgi:hypothetical protein